MNEQGRANAVDTETPAADSITQMGEYLENVLTRQREKIRTYDLDGAVVLAEEANEVAMELARAKAWEDAAYSEQRRRIQKLYQELSLIIAAERAEVADKLKAIRKGIRALGMYAQHG